MQRKCSVSYVVKNWRRYCNLYVTQVITYFLVDWSGREYTLHSGWCLTPFGFLTPYLMYLTLFKCCLKFRKYTLSGYVQSSCRQSFSVFSYRFACCKYFAVYIKVFMYSRRILGVAYNLTWGSAWWIYRWLVVIFCVLVCEEQGKGANEWHNSVFCRHWILAHNVSKKCLLSLIELLVPNMFYEHMNWWCRLGRRYYQCSPNYTVDMHFWMQHDLM